jgi:hypothetical protein
MPSIVRFEEVTADLGAPLVDGPGARDQYRLGYYLCAKEAATALRLRKGDNRSAMPILFLYRQYLELAFKDALERSKAFDLAQSEERFKHDLEKLWTEVQRVFSGTLWVEWTKLVSSVVAEFHAIDRRAEGFRYATNPNGDPQMPENAHVVYHELIEQMDDVHTVLELVIDEIRIKEAELDAAIIEAVSGDRS